MDRICPGVEVVRVISPMPWPVRRWWNVSYDCPHRLEWLAIVPRMMMSGGGCVGIG